MADNPRTTFRSVFAVPEFRAIWGAEAFSQVGDQLARVALAILVFNRTGSAALTALTYALTMAPAFLGGIFLAGLADRFPRRTIMVVVDLSRAVIIGLVAIPGIPFPILCVLVAAVSFLNAPFKAAQLATLPDVLAGDLYVAGMGIRSITIQASQLLGFAGGGALISAVNPYLALGLDAVTFLASALLVAAGVRSRPAPVDESGATKRVSPLSSAGAGARVIWQDTGLRVLMLLILLPGFLIVYEGLAAPYAAEIGGGTIAVGLILAGDPFGSVIGVLLFTRLVRPPTRVTILGPLGIVCCLPLLFCFLKPGVVLSVILFAVAGAFGTIVVMQATAVFTRGAPDSSRAQVLGLSNSGLATIQGVSPVLAGVLADQIGTAHTVGIVGLIGLAVAIPAAFAWRNATRERPQVWLEPADSAI